MRFSKTLIVTLASIAALAACDGRRSGSSSNDATFNVDDVTLEKVWTDKANPQDTEADRKFQFKACVSDAVARSAIVRTDFSVSDGVTDKKVTTDKDGCLFWDETHRISIIGKDQLLKVIRYVRGRGGFSGTVNVDLAFNPWNGDGLLYYLKRTTPPKIQSMATNMTFDADLLNGLGPNSTGGAETLVKSVSLSFKGHDKEQSQINSLLTLKPADKYIVSFDPKFVRLGLWNDRTSEDVRGGSFLLRIVVLREGDLKEITAADIVAEYNGEVTVNREGTVREQILLRIHDMDAALGRNQIVMILQPMGATVATARTGVFVGDVSPLKPGEISSSLQTIEDEQGPAVKAKVEVALEELLKPRKAAEIMTKDSRVAKETANAAKLLAQNPARPDGRLLSSYCEKFYRADEKVPGNFLQNWLSGGISKLSACKSSPDKYVKLSSRLVVENVVGNPRYIDKGNVLQKISISRSLSWSRTEGTSFDRRTGVSGEIGGSISAGIPESWTKWGPVAVAGSISGGAKVSIGKEWYVSTSETETGSTSVTQDQSLTVSMDVYEVDVNARRCVFVSSADGSGSLYACDEAITKKTIQESYYIVKRNIESSSTTDEDGPEAWRVLIRGDESYNDFVKLMTAGNGVLKLEKISGPSDSKNVLLPDFRINQTYPGVSSSSGR